MASAMTVPECRFRASWLMTTTGRRPACSAAADGIEISPVHLTSQYPGHVISSPVIPSSASALSSLRSSFRASTDRRLRRCRSSFSRTASSMARLRFRYSPDFTPRSISLTRSRSSVIAILSTSMVTTSLRWYDVTSYHRRRPGPETAIDPHLRCYRGLRLALLHPDQVTGLIVQDGNAYEEGLGSAVGHGEGVL